ncbi:MAG: hypothetical protein ACK4YP_25535, partial [Myxococcota bacterium]
RRAARALLDERTLLDGLVPPAGPALHALWDRVTEARDALRATVMPVPNDESGRARLTAGEDQPTWWMADGWRRICEARTGAEAGVRLQAGPGEPLVACSCGTPCALQVVALDTLLHALGHPEHPQHAWLATTLGTPAWQRAVADLDALLAEDAVPEEAVAGWRIDPERKSVTPMTCRPKRRGEGWKVTKMPIEEMIARPERFVLPADREIRDLLMTGGGYLTILVRLAGHPRVFVGNDPVVVRRVTVGMDWTPTDEGGVRIGLRLGERPVEARVLAGVATRPGWAILDEDGVIDVFQVDARLVRLVESLDARGGRFPAEATDAVLARLAALSRVVPARVAPALRGRAKEPDLRPVVRIDPLAEGGLLVQALVRPLAGGPAFPPGEGPDELHAGVGEDRVHVARVKATEAAAVRAALAGVPLPGDAE